MEVQLPQRNLTESIHEDLPTDRFIAWSMERFVKQRMVITTSFGMEGCALIDMYAAVNDSQNQLAGPLTVVYLDTMFFFKETYTLRDEMVERYPHVKFINGGTKLTPAEQAERYGDELWKTDPEKCCKLRKVSPMFDVMAGYDVWFTGLRRSQSASRANLQMIEWDWRYQVLKVSPLVKWERTDIWAYIQEHKVPYNKLHEQGYPTVGCTHCTQAVPGSTLGEYSRKGRWTAFDKTECGLHGGEGI